MCSVLRKKLLFQVNPFAQRILDIFIATDNRQMSFLEFLDMVSTFSPKVHVCHVYKSKIGLV